jgi:hypothetical protein
VRGGRIVAMSAKEDRLDDLIDASTAAAGSAEPTIARAFADAHEHLLDAAAAHCSSRSTASAASRSSAWARSRGARTAGRIG